MPGSSRAVLLPSLCSCHVATLKFVDDLLEDADEDHVLGARVLQLVEPQDHLASVQAVGAADVLAAGALGIASGCCSAQRNESRVIAVMLVDKDRVDTDRDLRGHPPIAS